MKRYKAIAKTVRLKEAAQLANNVEMFSAYRQELLKLAGGQPEGYIWTELQHDRFVFVRRDPPTYSEFITATADMAHGIILEIRGAEDEDLTGEVFSKWLNEEIQGKTS